MLLEYEYFLRLYLLLMKGGSELVRQIILWGLERQNLNMEQFLQIKKKHICSLDRIRKQEMEILYPTSQEVSDISKWDISLLCYIATEFFKKDLKDTEKLAVERIKDMRNKYSHHATFSIDLGTYTTEWSNLTYIIYTIAHEMEKPKKDGLTELINNLAYGFDIRAAIEELKELYTPEDNSRLLSVMHIELRQIREDTKVIPDIKKSLDELKVLLENGGITTKITNKCRGAIRVKTKDHNAEASVERLFIAAATDSESKPQSPESHPAVKEKVDKLKEDIEKKGVKIDEVTTGSIIFCFECSSISVLLDLIDFFESSDMKNRLDEISAVLEDILGEEVELMAYLLPESFQDTIETLQNMTEKPARSLQFSMTCNGVEGLQHALDVFEGDAASNSLNNLGKTLSKEVGQNVSLRTSIDIDEMQKAIQSTKEQIENEMASSMNKCDKCGKEISEETKKCNECDTVTETEQNKMKADTKDIKEKVQNIPDIKEKVQEISETFLELKTQLDNLGQNTNITNKCRGAIHVNTGDQNAVASAECLMIAAATDNIAKSQYPESHPAVKEKFDTLVENIKEKGVKIEKVTTGSVLFWFECSSISVLLDLIDFFENTDMKNHLNELSAVLEDILGEEVELMAYLLPESFKDTIEALQNEMGFSDDDRKETTRLVKVHAKSEISKKEVSEGQSEIVHNTTDLYSEHPGDLYTDSQTIESLEPRLGSQMYLKSHEIPLSKFETRNCSLCGRSFSAETKRGREYDTASKIVDKAVVSETSEANKYFAMSPYSLTKHTEYLCGHSDKDVKFHCRDHDCFGCVCMTIYHSQCKIEYIPNVTLKGKQEDTDKKKIDYLFFHTDKEGKLCHDKTKLIELCSNHRGEMVNFYCRSHNVLCSIECVIPDHRYCQLEYIPILKFKGVKDDTKRKSIDNPLLRNTDIGGKMWRDKTQLTKLCSATNRKCNVELSPNIEFEEKNDTIERISFTIKKCCMKSHTLKATLLEIKLNFGKPKPKPRKVKAKPRRSFRIKHWNKATCATKCRKEGHIIVTSIK